MRNIYLLAFIAVTAAAQQTVAPTPEVAGTPRGTNWQDYNIVDSVETGYRFASIGGNIPQYRSAVNYGNGIRLLSSSFSMNSKEGHGRFFDEILLTTQGLGNDPYESATFRIQKNELYRYDMTWRLNNYFNPGLTTNGAAGQHFLNTQYKMQDHDLTIFPTGRFKFFLGYTGSIQTGPAFTSVQLFDSRGSIFPLFSDLRRVRHEYRVGNEFQLFGVRVNWMHGWDNFKDDNRAALTSGSPGIVSTVTGIDAITRSEPYHGNSPYWRVAIFSDKKWLSFNGRFTYTSGARAFVVDESASGPGRFGAAQNRQIVTFGNGQRPVATGNLNVVLQATPKLTVTNSTSVYNVRMSGDSAFTQIDNSTLSTQLQYFNYLGIRTISNETDLNYQFSPWIGAFAGYQYTNRRINSIEQTAFLGDSEADRGNQTNQLNAGRFGLRLRPLKPLTVLLSAEVGRNDQPFTPIADRDYHALNARVQYRMKSFQATAGAESNYNVNSVSLSSYSSQSRKYYASGSYTPREWMTFDATYSRLHLYTIGGIAYFANLNLVEGESSIYLSNIHSFVGGARFAIRNRADVYFGYTHVQDTGDGRNTILGTRGGSALAIFQAAQTFPIAFRSPLARVSVRINNRLRWNAGYQYYGYREDFYATQNFRAHTGYSSLSWSF